MNSQSKRRLRRALARVVGVYPSSSDNRRIIAIRARMVTPNSTHEGQGRSVRIDRVPVRTPNGVLPMDIHKIVTRTTIHSKGPTGFYRGMYR